MTRYSKNDFPYTKEEYKKLSTSGKHEAWKKVRARRWDTNNSNSLFQKESL